MNRFLLGFFIIGLTLTACKKEDNTDYLPIDIEIIQQYVDDNNLNAEQLPSGVFIVKEEEGEGEWNSQCDEVVAVFYKGYLLDGTLFDSRWPLDEDDLETIPLDISLARVIPGWQIGVPEFGLGGKGKIIIPSPLAYGKQGSGTIPANTPIAFDIELVNYDDFHKILFDDYIQENNLTVTQTTDEGIIIIMEEEGIGEKPTAESTVSVLYKGQFLDGSVFDRRWPDAPEEYRREPIDFELNGLIEGWEIGLKEFKKGGKGKLLIPSKYGYGCNGSGTIAPNTPLVFDIELVDIK